MQLPHLASWKILKNKYLVFSVYSLFFLLIVYTVLSYSYWSYFILGDVLRRPFESKVNYLMRSLQFLSHENMHNPEQYIEYIDELASFEWEDVKEDLMQKYLATPLRIRSNYTPKQMFSLWPEQAKAECENIMMDHKAYGEKEYVKILYLYVHICVESFNGEAMETCKKIRKILKDEKSPEIKLPIDADIDLIKKEMSLYCPDCPPLS